MSAGNGASEPGIAPERTERVDHERGDRGDRGDRFDRDRGDRGDRERGGYGDRNPSLKARLRARARKKARKAGRLSFNRRKVCRFCADSNLRLDYKDAKSLRFFISETGKLIPQRISGNCAIHQRQVTVAIKRARQIALMPFSVTGF